MASERSKSRDFLALSFITKKNIYFSYKVNRLETFSSVHPVSLPKGQNRLDNRYGAVCFASPRNSTVISGMHILRIESPISK